MSEHSKKILLRLLLTFFEIIFFSVLLFIIFFFLFRSLPGNVGAVGQGTTPEQIEFRRRELGLDLPLGEQFIRYASLFLQTGSLGVSYVSSPGLQVTQFVFSYFLTSLQYTLPATALSILAGTIFGIIAGNRVGKTSDSVLSLIHGVLLSTPAVILAIFFSYLGSVNFGEILPASYNSARPTISLILPFFTILFISLPASFFLVRTAVINESKEQYITFAKAKGVSNFRIASVHSIKQVLYPVATVAPISLFAAISGAAFTETIFNIPGAGKNLIQAIQQTEYNVAFVISLVGSLIVLLGYAARDILYLVLDPRVRKG